MGSSLKNQVALQVRSCNLRRFVGSAQLTSPLTAFAADLRSIGYKQLPYRVHFDVLALKGDKLRYTQRVAPIPGQSMYVLNSLGKVVTVLTAEMILKNGLGLKFIGIAG